MKVILAQGNPGTQYASTRHNIGWILLDALASNYDAIFTPEKKFAADIATVTIDGEKTLLVKPATFYNETGRTARALVDFYKLNPASDLLVIHDDLSLPFGTVRVRDKGSDAGNNGIKSISSHIGPEYWRVRVGIEDGQRERQPDADFVLSRPSVDTAQFVNEKITPVVTEMIVKFCNGALAATSHHITIQN
jgi:PTH1 family peptidyl-tRNA hydrolase